MTRNAAFFLGSLLFAALTAPAIAQPAGSFSSLEERMSSAEFQAAGLDKLTTEELASLNAWLKARTEARPGPRAAARGEDRIGFRDSPQSEGSVVSRIQGEFTGWTGNTRFVLENGQVWQQAESGAVHGVRLDSPVVRIAPAFMGGWRMQVEGSNHRVRVRRIE